MTNPEKVRKVIYKHFSNVLELGDDYRVVCIFHKDTDPSLSIDKKTGMFFCFGCETGGQFNSLLRALGEKDIEAKIHALENWGDVMNRIMGITDEEEKVSHPMPTGFVGFSKKTKKTRHHMYMTNRNISTKTLRYFGAGYVAKNQVYNRYRDRVVIPVLDENGNMAFPEGRLITEAPNIAKYMRPKKSKKGLLLSKNVLFNYNNVKRFSEVVLVEGVMDVLTLWGEWKIPSVACFNPVLSSKQVGLLSIFETVYICFDNDKAGRVGEKKALYGHEKSIGLLGKGIEVRVIRMAKGMDPNKMTYKSFMKRMKKSKLIV